MEGQRPVTGKLIHRRRLLSHGRSASLSVGLIMVLIVLGVLCGAAWWAFRTQMGSMEEQRARAVQAVGDVLCPSAEAFLAAGELSPLRRLVAQCAREHGLTRCRVVLGDGQVIADGDPARITVRDLPEDWPEVPWKPPEAASGSESLSRTYRLKVPGKGTAQLEIAAQVRPPAAAVLQAQAGLGAGGVAALIVLLIAHRGIRRRLRSLDAVGSALLARGAGERAAEVLAVSEDYGPLAGAWNELLREHGETRGELLLERAKETLASGGLAHNRLESACEAMSQGLLLLDEGLTVRYANGAAAGFLRSTRQKVVGGNIEAFVESSEVLEAVRAAAGGAACWPTAVEVGTLEADGILRFSVRPLRNGDTLAAMVMIEDVTQKRVTDGAANAFVAQATHELRTPLTNIHLHVQKAMQDGKDAAETRACLNVINQEAKRLERMVGDILSVAEIETGSLALSEDDVRLEPLLSELRADCEAQAKDKHLRLVVQLPPKLPVIRADQAKLELALHNLLDNAMKYTPSGGEVKLAVEATDGQVRIEVSDTGIGIDQEDLERIFEKFYRAKDRRVTEVAGSGLGLALARQFARLHGGDLVVRSRLNEGSCFTMTVATTGRPRPVTSQGD